MNKEVHIISNFLYILLRAASTAPATYKITTSLIVCFVLKSTRSNAVKFEFSKGSEI